MGQAAVDVPDPKDAAPATAATNSADDLLAQLAGEEIDRLLAEDSPPENAPENVSTESMAEDSAAEIDAILNAAENAPPAPAVLVKAEEKAEEKVEAKAEVNPENVADEAATAAEMRQLLNDKSIDAAKVHLPIYVRALELINSPFSKLPDTAREAIGKVAILTLFNSVAVLLYVLIFRRK